MVALIKFCLKLLTLLKPPPRLGAVVLKKNRKSTPVPIKNRRPAMNQRTTASRRAALGLTVMASM
ncbi:hypothetical protein, partial [Pseudomonas viridiflava]|uniref:hypothetical protein n=1 Tax=Pseudomonas viridiflava TaxID=33069 RepID=UPI0019D069E6